MIDNTRWTSLRAVRRLLIATGKLQPKKQVGVISDRSCSSFPPATVRTTACDSNIHRTPSLARKQRGSARRWLSEYFFLSAVPSTSPSPTALVSKPATMTVHMDVPGALRLASSSSGITNATYATYATRNDSIFGCCFPKFKLTRRRRIDTGIGTGQSQSIPQIRTSNLQCIDKSPISEIGQSEGLARREVRRTRMVMMCGLGGGCSRLVRNPTFEQKFLKLDSRRERRVVSLSILR